MLTRDKSFYKSFFSLFWLLVLQNVIALSVNLADNIMIGSYSETALSGVAAVNQIQFLFQTTILGCADALVVIGSQYWGKQKTEPIKRAFTGAFMLAFSIAAVLFAAAFFVPTIFLPFTALLTTSSPVTVRPDDTPFTIFSV